MKQQNKDHRRRASRNHNFWTFKIIPVKTLPVQKTVAPKIDKSFFVIVTLIVVAILLSILTVYFIKL